LQATAKTKGELISEIHAKIVSTAIREISPTGVKLESNTQDQLTGRLNAQGMSTITSWQKTDGTAEWEVKGIGYTPDGDSFAGWGKGTRRQTGPTSIASEGEMHMMSQSPKLAWLNDAKIWAEGSGDFTKAEFVVRFYLQK
jgi:hypothetical protein